MRTPIIVLSIFMLIGLGLLTGGGLSFKHTSEFISQALRAQGEIVELQFSRGDSKSSGSYYPVVKFLTTDGKEITFKSGTGSNPAGFKLGDKVEVYYSANEPSKAEINTFFRLWFLTVLLLGMGTVFSAIPGLFLLVTLRKRKLKRWLEQFGQRVGAQVTGVTLNSSYSVNGRNPYVINAQWQNPATGLVHTFCSDNIWFDPSQFLTEKNIQVLVDLKDPEKYVIDLSFLPKMAA